MNTLPDAFTVVEAARRCGVNRSTLQRAIAAGRLVLTPDHRLTTAALQQAGYAPAAAAQQPRSDQDAAPHAPAAQQPHDAAGTQMLALLERLLLLAESIREEVRQLSAAQQPHATAAAAADAQRRAAEAFLPQPHWQRLEPGEKHVLGKLCKNKHDWRETGHSIRQRRNASCLACNAERKKEERRQAKEQR